MIRNRQFTPEQLQKLRASASGLEKKLNDVFTPEFALAVSVNDSWTLEVPQDMQIKYQVSPYGRKSIKDDKVVMHVAPKPPAPSIKYQSQDTNMIADVQHYASRGYASFNQDPVLPMIPLEKASIGPLMSYERSLLEKLSSCDTTIVLLNPSGSSIWAAENLNVKIVCDDSQREHVVRQYSDMRPSRPVPWLEGRPPRNAIYYVGAHGPYGDLIGKKWYSLTPNPESYPIYRNWRTIRQDAGTRVIYDTKTHYDYVIYDTPVARRFSSETTDSWLDQLARHFFLETNVDLILPRSEKLHVGDVYVQSPIPVLGSDGVRKDHQYVWDIDGCGTYFSRRSKIERIAYDLGLLPVPLNSEGDIPVGVQTEYLCPMSYHRNSRGWSLVPFRHHASVPDDSPKGCLITQNPVKTPLKSCPGLYYEVVRYDPVSATLDTIESNYFFVRQLSEAQSRLPLILKLFGHDERGHTYTPNGKGPPQQWGKVQLQLDDAASTGKSFGSLIQSTSIPSAVFGQFIALAGSYVLYSPAMKSVVESVFYDADVSMSEYSFSATEASSLAEYFPKEAPYDRVVAFDTDFFTASWIQSFRRGIHQTYTPAHLVALRCTFLHYAIDGGGLLYQVSGR